MSTPPKGAKTPVKSKKRLTPQQFEADVKTKLDAIGEDQYDRYLDLKKRQTEAFRGVIHFWWQAGKHMFETKKKYELKGVVALAEALEISTQEANAALRLYIMVPTQAKYLELISEKDKAGKPISWGLLRRIITGDLADEAKWKYIRAALAEGWGNDDLTLKLQTEFGPRPGATGGRPIATDRITSLVALLSKLDAMHRVNLKYSDAVFANDTAIASIIDRTPVDRYTPEMLAQLDTVDNQIDQLAERAVREKANLRTIRTKVESVLGVTSEKAAEKAAEKTDKKAEAADELRKSKSRLAVDEDDEEEVEDDEEVDETEDAEDEDDEEVDSDTTDDEDEEDDEDEDDDEEEAKLPPPRPGRRADRPQPSPAVRAKAAAAKAVEAGKRRGLRGK